MITPHQPRDRVLFLSQQVTQESMLALTREIIAIETSDTQLADYYAGIGGEYKPQPIRIYIDSYGGEVYSCLGLLSVMELCSTPIQTIVTGCAMSCGFMILIGGHERIAYPNSTVMLHQVSTWHEGKLGDIITDMKETVRLQKIIEKLVKGKTKITAEDLVDNFTQKEDWFMSSREALKLGVVDRIARSNVL